MDKPRVFASSGGGVRIGASFGAELEGERQSKFHWSMFDYYVGTSAGALDALLTANRWSASEKRQLFLNTDFAKFFTPALVPYELRKLTALNWPIQLKKLAAFIDGLGLKAHPGLLVNSVDAEDNAQVIYCDELPPWADTSNKAVRWEPGAFKRWSLGTLLTRSMVLPGLLADDPRWLDGGVAENPLLSVLPQEAHILLIHLGYAGLVKKDGGTSPKGALQQALYAYEFKAFSYAEHLMGHFPNLRVVYPKVYDVDSSAFNLNFAAKLEMLRRAQANTRPQWEAMAL